MNSDRRIFCALLGAALLAWTAGGKPGLPPLDGATPTKEQRPAVSAALSEAVAPVAALMKDESSDERKKFAAFWRAQSENLAWPDVPVKTTGKLRGLWTTAGQTYYKGKLAGPGGLADAIDSVLTGELGEDDAALDSKSRAKASAIFAALATAAGG